MQYFHRLTNFWDIFPIHTYGQFDLHLTDSWTSILDLNFDATGVENEIVSIIHKQ